MSRAQIAEMLAQSDLAHEEMVEVVDVLLPLDELVGEAPAPSDELAALFEPERPQEVTRLGRRRGAVAGALVLALSGVGATGLSAAANTLPRPLQHGVSQFSHHYLPVRLPEPPPVHERSDGLPALAPDTPAATTTGRQDPASRSVTGRPDTPAVPAPIDPSGHARPTPAAQEPSWAQPSAAPSYAPESAGPSPAAQPAASGSSTPADRPRGGPGPGNDNGHDNGNDNGNGNGHDPEKGHGPGNGNGNGNGNGGQAGKPGKPGKGGGPAPAPAPGPAAPAPQVPQPDPPTPTLPLPAPLPGVNLPGLDGITGTS
jgi:hypothetical protein